MFNPPHPGVILREWLDGVSVTDAADKIGVTRVSLSRVLNRAAGISPAMDIRLSQSLGTTPGFWLRLQNSYDIHHEMEVAKKSKLRVKPMFESTGVVEHA